MCYTRQGTADGPVVRGVFLALGRLVLLVLAIVFQVYFRFLIIRREERLLAERYGDASRECARSVSRWWTWQRADGARHAAR
jgi:protein-S-isoprenylcysteine O-methyltransferase Ste14